MKNVTKTELKIVKLLIQDKKPKTIREIAGEINSDYRIVYTSAHKLIDKNILTAETLGSSSLCRLNKFYYGREIYEAEDERKTAILRNKNLHQIYKEVLSKINTSFFVLLLFGSYASDRQTKSSDIDLLFISNERDFEAKITDILSLLPLKIHPLVFTEEEFIRMKDSKKPNIIPETIEKNIILYGIEAYYRLKNA